MISDGDKIQEICDPCRRDAREGSMGTSYWWRGIEIWDLIQTVKIKVNEDNINIVSRNTT